jgi:hypothetical protein
VLGHGLKANQKHFNGEHGQESEWVWALGHGLKANQKHFRFKQKCFSSGTELLQRLFHERDEED